jgi:putative phosphoesterase
MKIAVLSDIHGNLPAMQAVANRISRLKIDKVLVLGDIVGYYYQFKEVLSILQGFNDVEFIQGNHEYYLEKARHDKKFLLSITQKYGSSIRLAIENLDLPQLDWLSNLPEKKTVIINNKKLLMSHGSPKGQNDYIYPDSDLNILDTCITGDHDYVLMGNTHYPFVCMHKNTILLNPGSVGQPRDMGSLASFATIDTVTGSIVFHRVAFDFKDVVNMARKYDPHLPYLVNVFNRV